VYNGRNLSSSLDVFVKGYFFFSVVVVFSVLFLVPSLEISCLVLGLQLVFASVYFRIAIND